MKTALPGLNPAQRRAVLHGDGPLLIIAGAGTGKTKVITERIAHLISSKRARPEDILAVTFTERAAGEMEARVDVLVPYTYSYVHISTFNSFGEKVLRDYALEMGYPPDFKLLDDVEQAIFLRQNLFNLPLDYFRPLSHPTRYILELLDTIRRLKQEDVKPAEYVAYSADLRRRASTAAEKERARKNEEVAAVFQDYQTLLRKNGLIDFEDQVTLVVELFRSRPSVLREFQEKYRYILVDEFQDTNSIQFELLKMLAAGHRNLTVVGDDDQSIFRFRGASLSNILNFQEIYPEAKRIVLTRNYRSAQPVLDASYRLIQHNNPGRLEAKYKVDKRLKSEVGDTPEKSLFMLQFDTLSHEADRVAELLLEKHAEGHSWSRLAVLVRRNADADPFLRAFNLKQIPYRFSGSRGLYQQEEVKVLVAFIKSLTDFEDSRDLFYLALSDIYRASPYDMTRLANYTQKKNLSLHQVFREVHAGTLPVDISPETAAAVKRIFDDLLYFIDFSRSRSAGEVVYAFLEKSGLLRILVEQVSLETEIKIRNIRLFFDKIKGFSEIAADDSIHSFSGYLDLLQEVGDNPATAEADLDDDAVNVLTVHKAKGLEFDVVFMVRLTEDRFPGRGRKERVPVPGELLQEGLPDAENTLQEERRLFYVAMTRARSALTMTWSRDDGRARLKKVSPFVLEALDIPKMPEEVLKATALEEIRRYALSEVPSTMRGRSGRPGLLTLSYVQVEDYLLCPLKYRFRHLMKVPAIPHHSLVFGRVLHGTIHEYLKSVLKGKRLSSSEVLDCYERSWINEGYLSREHEELRKTAGRRAILEFIRMEEDSGRIPVFLEKSFRWREGLMKFTGRWDRVDFEEEGAVVIDYKTTEIESQKEADLRTADSLQLDLYALSFLKTQGHLPVETRLHFLESGLVGRARKGEKELRRAAEMIRVVETGIRADDFASRPGWQNCSACEFKTICPSSFAY